MFERAGLMANPSNDQAVFTYFNEIGIISQLSTGLFEQGLPEGLTLSQFSVLNWFVRVDVEATPGRLARAFQVTGGAMTNTLKKLESKGLVKVEPDKNSGRRKRVAMTRKGNQVRDKAIKSVAPLLREFAERFPIEKLKRQTRQLAEVREYLDERRYK
jgi:DNA-binding MarR family transcriptional regulator